MIEKKPIQVNQDLILKLERLARISLDEEARAKLSVDLTEILEMVAKLDELELDDVEPLRHISPVRHLLREDAIKDQLSNEDALSNAPERDGPFFKVPKVIDR